MFPRNPSASLVRSWHIGLLWALAAVPLHASCTKSEDTEPFVPAKPGAEQPAASGALIGEDAACERVRAAYHSADGRLGCDLPKPPECPGFIRPGGGNGCYEYSEDSVAACEKAYSEASSCGSLTLCVVSAARNDNLPTCSLGAGGADQGGGAGQSSGGTGPTPGAAGAEMGGAASLGDGGAPLGGAPAAMGGAPG